MKSNFGLPTCFGSRQFSSRGKLVALHCITGAMVYKEIYIKRRQRRTKGKNMIYYFNVLENPAKTAEILKNSNEKDDIIRELNILKGNNGNTAKEEFYLKAIYDCTDALYSIKENKREILKGFDTFLEFIKITPIFENKRNPNSPIYCLVLGNIYMRKGQYKLENDTPDDNLTNNAITQFKKIPENLNNEISLLAKNNLGKCYRNLGSNPQKFDKTSLKKAKKNFEIVSENCKADLNIYENLFLNAKKNLGRCYMKMEEFRQEIIQLMKQSCLL